MKIAVGIVTKGRKAQLLSLLEVLTPQLLSTDKIFIVENGSTDLNKKTTELLTSKKVFLRHQKKSEISPARNFIFNKVKNTFDVLVYLDDDCYTTKDFLLNIRQYYTKHPKAAVLQGKTSSIPVKNIYAQTSGLLYDYWLKTNLLSMHKLLILDTKNVVFNLHVFRKKRNLFNEDPQYMYCEDIELASKLNQEKVVIYYSPKIRVEHLERTDLFHFVLHRYRLSKLFRRVLALENSHFQASSVTKKYLYLWNYLDFEWYEKFSILTLLTIIYSYVSLTLILKKFTFPTLMRGI